MLRFAVLACKPAYLAYTTHASDHGMSCSNIDEHVLFILLLQVERRLL